MTFSVSRLGGDPCLIIQRISARGEKLQNLAARTLRLIHECQELIAQWERQQKNMADKDFDSKARFTAWLRRLPQDEPLPQPSDNRICCPIDCWQKRPCAWLDFEDEAWAINFINWADTAHEWHRITPSMALAALEASEPK